jgi:hypothetical protein
VAKARADVAALWRTSGSWRMEGTPGTCVACAKVWLLHGAHASHALEDSRAHGRAWEVPPVRGSV